MNQRIQELKSQCIFQERKGTNAFDSYVVDRFDTEKFAELIVLECCQMMLNLEVKYPANLTVSEIKKHFGIDDVDTQLRQRSTYFGNNP